MPVVNTGRRMTSEELLALPDDGVERWLIKGELHEKRDEPILIPSVLKERDHGALTATMTYLLERWRRGQAEPRGRVFAGLTGVRLRRDPDLAVDGDVVYLDAETAARQGRETKLIDGLPVLVVEILSPGDTFGHIGDLVDSYVSAGVKLVWVVEPWGRCVTVYRPDAHVELFSLSHELSAEPHLPGFRVAVSHLFE